MQAHKHSSAQSRPFRGRKGPSYIQGAQALIQPPGSMLSPQAGKKNRSPSTLTSAHDQSAIHPHPHDHGFAGAPAGGRKGRGAPVTSCSKLQQQPDAAASAAPSATIRQQANQHINRPINQHPRATGNAGYAYSTGNETASTWRKASAATRSLQRGHRRSQCASSCWRCGRGSRAACCNAACTC